MLDDISTGASNDIERATKIARAMVMKYGMSEKLGPITYGTDESNPFLGKEMGAYQQLFRANRFGDRRGNSNHHFHRLRQDGADSEGAHIDELHRLAAYCTKGKLDGADSSRLWTAACCRLGGSRHWGPPPADPFGKRRRSRSRRSPIHRAGRTVGRPNKPSRRGAGQKGSKPE